MSAAFTVLLPHKRNPGNDDALAICIDCLMKNTDHDFILMIDAAVNEPLQARINRMARQAPTEICVYHASDMFFAPHWDTPMLDLYTPETFVTNVVVEPRAIAMYEGNLEHNFGMRPETFQRRAFEAWSVDAPLLGGTPWYCPYMFSKTEFFKHGGLEENLAGEFNAADMRLFERWKSAGNQVVRAKGFVYHLQKYSDVTEQMHEKRRA